MICCVYLFMCLIKLEYFIILTIILFIFDSVCFLITFIISSVYHHMMCLMM